MLLIGPFSQINTMLCTLRGLTTGKIKPNAGTKLFLVMKFQLDPCRGRTEISNIIFSCVLREQHIIIC